MATVDLTSTSGSSMPALVVQNSNQTQNANTNYSQNQTSSQTPQFTQGQLNMQGQAQDLYSKILSGQVQNFGLDPATRQAAWYDFQQNQLPLLSAQNGVGSPALNAAAEQLNLRLAGMSGQMALPQAIQTAQGLANTAFSPVGYNTANQSTQNQQQVQTNQGTQSTANVGGTINGISDWLTRYFQQP